MWKNAYLETPTINELVVVIFTIVTLDPAMLIPKEREFTCLGLYDGSRWVLDNTLNEVIMYNYRLSGGVKFWAVKP